MTEHSHQKKPARVRLKTYGDKAFPVAALKLWSDLPLETKLSPSVAVLKLRLELILLELLLDNISFLLLSLVHTIIFSLTFRKTV